MTEKLECFIICPLGKANSEERKRSDTMLEFVLSPVLEKMNYKPIRADQIPKVGLITSQIIQLLIDSPLVIADLTGSNPNVFYELAVRHAVRKPFVQIIETGATIPFDITGIRTIEIDLKDLKSVELAKGEIESQIKEFSKGHKPDSPISIAQSAKLLQNDSDLASEIVERIGYLEPYINYSNSFTEDSKAAQQLERIDNKLRGFSEFSFLGMEDLDQKLQNILNKLDNKNI